MATQDSLLPAGDMPDKQPRGRQLSRNETHDLSMIIKDRAKVLKAHAEEQAAACLADFERKLAAEYSWDQDDVWKTATEKAKKELAVAQKTIAARCEELGIPKTFAPTLDLNWYSRGENAVKRRRDELRKVAITSIDAMKKSAFTLIEKQSLELRTQVVGLGLLSDDAKFFLESLAPVEQAMRSIDLAEIEKRAEHDRLAYHREYS